MTIPKTIGERISEMKNIYLQMYDLGIDEHVCEGMRQFKEVANRFVKEGIGASGRIQLHEINRDLVYILSTQPHVVSSVVLKHLSS